MKPSTVIRFAVLCIVFSAALVAALYTFMEKPNSQRNGFVRKIRTQRLKVERVLKLGFPAYYYAGYSEGRLFLANYSASQHLLSIDVNLQDTDHLQLKMPAHDDYAYQFSRIVINGDHVYLADGITPKLFAGRVDDLIMKHSGVRTIPFTSFVPLSPSSFIVRNVKSIAYGNIVSKITGVAPYISENAQIIRKQPAADGIFDTDGALLFDRASATIYYLYYYRNQFVSVDTNLHIKYSATMIDTNTVSKVQVATISSSGSRTFSAPKVMVNQAATVDRDTLYVFSALKADNERKADHDANETIDVYLTKNGSYLYTIYLPKEHDKPSESMWVLNHQLYVIRDTYLCKYILPSGAYF